LALGILIALGAANAPRIANASPVLTIGSASVNVGDVFSVPVSISGAVSLASFQFDLSFDPSIVTVIGIDDSGTDFAAAASNGGGFTFQTGFIDINNATGLLSGFADSMSGVSDSGLINGVLANITFQALAPGVSPLILSNGHLTDGPDGGAFLESPNDFALQNGEIIVGRSQVTPLPGSLPLFVSGLLGLWALRRRGVSIYPPSDTI
jgi:hypothetical protein